MKTNKTAGFALIDAAIALALVVFAALILGAIYPGLTLSRLSRSKVTANAIAQKKIDELRGIQFDSLALQVNTPFSDSDLSKLYAGSADYSIEEYDIDGDGTAEPEVKKITVTVSWQEAGQNKNWTLTSLATQTGLNK